MSNVLMWVLIILFGGSLSGLLVYSFYLGFTSKNKSIPEDVKESSLKGTGKQVKTKFVGRA
ncbi:MAG: hypothetical protein ABIL68_01445 [bacterium]